MKFRIPYIFWISAGWPTLTIITYDLISYHLPLTLELTNESEIQDILTSLSALIITVIYLEVIIRLLLYYY